MQIQGIPSPFGEGGYLRPRPSAGDSPATSFQEALGAALAERSPSAAAPAPPEAPAAPPPLPADFTSWFQSIHVESSGVPERFSWSYTWPDKYSATRAGAEAALALVQRFVPDARIRGFTMPYQVEAAKISHAIELPDGEWLNAGLVLDTFYHEGRGADAWSELWLQTQIQRGWPGYCIFKYKSGPDYPRRAKLLHRTKNH